LSDCFWRRGWDLRAASQRADLRRLRRLRLEPDHPFRGFEPHPSCYRTSGKEKGHPFGCPFSLLYLAERVGLLAATPLALRARSLRSRFSRAARGCRTLLFSPWVRIQLPQTQQSERAPQARPF